MQDESNNSDLTTSKDNNGHKSGPVENAYHGLCLHVHLGQLIVSFGVINILLLAVVGHVSDFDKVVDPVSKVEHYSNTDEDYHRETDDDHKGIRVV